MENRVGGYTEEHVSGYIEDFLNFLSRVEGGHKIKRQELDAQNTNLQDLEHYIEFGKAECFMVFLLKNIKEPSLGLFAGRGPTQVPRFPGFVIRRSHLNRDVIAVPFVGSTDAVTKKVKCRLHAIDLMVYHYCHSFPIKGDVEFATTATSTKRHLPHV